MIYESPLAAQVKTQGLGHRRGKLAERYLAPCAVVIHTTGAGPIKRAMEDRFALWRRRYSVGDGDTLQAAVALYTRVMEASGHYVIDQAGTIVQLVPESHCAWHVGGRGSRPYFTNPGGWGKGSRYAWWAARWAGYESPRQLGGGRLWDPPHEDIGLLDRFKAGLPIGSANANTIGIEVVPSAVHPTGPWSAEAWHALTRLVLDICARHAIPVKRDRVITHSDAHPLERTSPSGKPWDTSPAQFTWERFERSIAGMPAQATA